MDVFASDVEQLVFNRGRLGYFRVQYNDEANSWMRQHFISRSSQLTGVDRAAYLNDVAAFAQPGRTKTVEVLDLLQYLSGETDVGVWSGAMRFLLNLESLFWEQSEKDKDALRGFARSVLADTYAEIGLFAGANETATTGKIRQLILPVAGRARIPGLVDECIRLLRIIYEGEIGHSGVSVPVLPVTTIAAVIETVS